MQMSVASKVFDKVLMVVEVFWEDHVHVLRMTVKAMVKGGLHWNFPDHLQNMHAKDPVPVLT